MKLTLALIAVLLLASVPATAASIATATIANSATDSSVIQTSKSNVGIYLLRIPASFTGATVSFECSETSGGTYEAIVDSTGSALSVTATDSSWVSLSSIAGSLAACRFLKVISASAETGAKTLTLMWK